jgi:rhodanese-related sulfurtransferase
VDGQQFAWHQPGNSVSYPVSSIGNSAKDHDVLAEEKPVSLPSRKFAEAKAIIAWCLQGVPAERRELSTLCASGREGMRTV